MGKRPHYSLRLRSGRVADATYRADAAEVGDVCSRFSKGSCNRCARLKSWRRGDSGQALAELPYVVLLCCVLTLLIVQPVVFLYTQMALGQIASGVGRIVATESTTPTGSKEVLIRAYAADKLEGLPRGKAFRVPGTLRVEVKGNAQSERIEVKVSVKQEPLPLMGLLLGAGINQDLEVSGCAVTRGARVGVAGTPRSAPQSYGNIQAK